MKNLHEFCSTYRVCPFCDQELVLRAQRSAVTSIPGFLPEISVTEYSEEIILTYEADNSFNKSMKLFLDSIVVDKYDNVALYLFIDKHVLKDAQFDDTLIFLLNSNHVSFYMSCLCSARYSISLKSIKLDNSGVKLADPELFSEYFSTDLDGKRIEIVSLFAHDKTTIMFSTLQENGFPKIVHEIVIPLVRFDFSDKETTANKIKTLITYS